MALLTLSVNAFHRIERNFGLYIGVLRITIAFITAHTAYSMDILHRAKRKMVISLKRLTNAEGWPFNFERARAPRHFLHGKWHPKMRN